MFGITFIKKVNIKEIYEKFNMNKTENDKNWFDRLDLEKDEHPNLEFNVSDNRDIMVKLTSNGHKLEAQNAINELKKKLGKEEVVEVPSIFVFIANNDQYKKYNSIKKNNKNPNE